MSLAGRTRFGAPNIVQWAHTTGLALSIMLLAAPSAWAQDAPRVLKAMFDYVGSQKSIALTYDTDVEVMTPDLQKIQFAASGELQLNRPDKLRATRTGGYADIELLFDGKTATISGKGMNVFAQKEAAGSVDDLVDKLRSEAGMDIPGADLLLARGYDEVMKDVIDSKHIGQGVIDGVECEHLAFRNAEVDWQIWIQLGTRPIPRKYVITSKMVAGGPQYTLRIKDWKTDAPAAADAFVFKNAAGMTKVEISALRDIDEIPHGVEAGAKK